MLFLALSSDGFGWIPNLTDVDHSLILPVFMALSNLAIIEVIIPFLLFFFNVFNKFLPF